MSTGLFRVNDLNKTIVLDITDNTGIDLSLVTAGNLKWERPDGTTGTWTGVLSNQSATTLRISFTTASTAPSELDQPGDWGVYGSMTHSVIGHMRTEPVEMWVDPEYRSD